MKEKQHKPPQDRFSIQGRKQGVVDREHFAPSLEKTISECKTMVNLGYNDVQVRKIVKTKEGDTVRWRWNGKVMKPMVVKPEALSGTLF